MTDDLDAKLNAAVQPLREKGGEHHSLADLIVAAIKAGVEHLRAELAPKAEQMLAKAGYEPVKPADPKPAA